MMNFIEIAKKRYSVRNYSGKKVEKEKLDKILQAAHVAPTAANLAIQFSSHFRPKNNPFE